MPEKRYDYVNTSDVLRHAIEDNTIPVLYQPIFDVNTKRITSLDTIVRVHDAQGCTLAPRIRKLLRSRIAVGFRAIMMRSTWCSMTWKLWIRLSSSVPLEAS